MEVKLTDSHVLLSRIFAVLGVTTLVACAARSTGETGDDAANDSGSESESESESESGSDSMASTDEGDASVRVAGQRLQVRGGRVALDDA